MEPDRAEQLEKYEAWVAGLERNLDEVVRQRRALLRIGAGVVVASLAGFFFGAWLGVATFSTGLMLAIAGGYMTTTRRLEYERDLRRAREEVLRLRGELPPHGRVGEYEF